ncbi:palmitoyltransferase PFA4 [Wolfiporia cocos MD-104 SS10]|uniref:Palmitoyltransferase PFA4 n=1 Tax=Wolfiporia cocos (strain MD-104) TaxID=742152 RepID=A0A2H3IW77_WOLCO|nr:palmitoyltransferase PFA4 [Wolfiporia cocos MD-104 SS10]
MGRLTGRLFVGFTLLLIFFIAYSAQIFIIWPWYGREVSVELLTLLVPFNVFVGMLLWNYYLCAMTDPGRVPSGWQPDIQDSDGYEVKKITRGPRYCRTCEGYKPPRAHHCKQCKRCVLPIDHHCPWVNNCVGHFNYGHFIRFLFYVDVACSYHFAMVARRVYNATQYWENLPGTELIFIILNFATCIPVLLAVGGFSLYHFYCLSGNATTIEGWEKDKVATLVRHGKIHEIKFPYNLGIKRNICSVLGDNPLLWCLPTVPPGTGLKYQLAVGDDPSAEFWPPQDPTKPDPLGEPDPNHEFKLPDSPWTYQNGLNPHLTPSNARRRSPQNKGPYSSLPPYHPDYHESQAQPYSPSSDSEAESSSDEYGEKGGPRVRRGSEGYEVRPIDREAMLRGFIEGRTHEPGRYQLYMPEPPSEGETEDDPEDAVPLAQRVGSWRAARKQ